MADPWLLRSDDPTDLTPALLWNGQVGFRIARDASGRKMPFFSIDEYDVTGEEKIRQMDSPLPNGVVLDGKPLPITGDYRQTLNLKTSELTTHWASGKFVVDCSIVLDPIERMIGERWIVTGADTTDKVDFDLGALGKMGKEAMLSTHYFWGPSKMKCRLMANRYPLSKPTFDVVMSFGASPNRAKMGTPAAQTEKANDPLNPASSKLYDDLKTQAAACWAERWKTDIEIDGPVEDQQAVRSFMFYLRSALSPSGGMSISPFGLSDQMYNGHVFWDADIWVFPALALIDPDLAKAIPAYRSMHPNGSKFAWESSVTGKETVPGPSQKEIHINGDVAWCLNQAAALGIAGPIITRETVQSIANYFKSVSTPIPGSNERAIKDVMSPDENHIGDNDLYTNLLAQWCANGGTWKPGTRSGDPIPTYKLPKDGKSFLTYDDDLVRAYKQAAAVLSIYPLQYPPAEAQAEAMMNRFAPKVSKNGPAMSDSVHALIWARIGHPKEAYETWKNSWQPFTNHSLMLFSEKRSKTTSYFTTGAAGSLQTVLFGFLGFRLDSSMEQGAAWSKQLQGNNWLSIKPNLPQKWKSVKLRNFTVLGHHYTLTATHRPSGPDAAQVLQGD